MTAQMQMHIREVNSMFADERKKVRERYKEYDGIVAYENTPSLDLFIETKSSQIKMKHFSY